MGRPYEYTWEIVEHDAPSRMRVESTSGPFPTTLAFEFNPREGGTWVEASVTGRPSGVMRALQPLVGRTTQQNLDRAYPRLKKLMETGSAA
jgi:hypothetical protein